MRRRQERQGFAVGRWEKEVEELERRDRGLGYR